MATIIESERRGPLTRYVGRTVESDEIRRLLGHTRLVTLTGPGGVGKTRLAQQVADTVRRAYADGVVYIGLAEVRDERLLAGLIAQRLGLHDRSTSSELETIAGYLRPKRMLLVLDNCEHMVDACAELVETLLHRCPRVVVLSTSRRSLGVAGEHVLLVPPLGLPSDSPASAHEQAQSEAVQLFVDRAETLLPTFRLTEENTADVVRVCRQVDGLPLAIELAAARIRALTPGQIADRLADSLALLTTTARTVPERQRTMRATMDSSFALCSDVERAVWSRCSVFAGSFDVAAAEYVCAGPGVAGDAVLAAIDGLIDMSVLLREEGHRTARYRMLETLRDFGHERLAEQGEEDRVARRHRDYYDMLTADADAEWFGPLQPEWMARLRDERANLRVALTWSLSEPGEALTALQMATRVFEYWVMCGAPREARDWIDRALDTTGENAPGRAAALGTSALCALFHSDVPLAKERLEDAAKLDDPEAYAHLTYVRAFAKMTAVEPGSADLAAEAVRAFEAKGDVRRQMHPLFIHGVSTAYLGDLETARTLLRRMLSLTKDARDENFRSMALFGIGVVEVWFGDLAVADKALGKALAIDARAGDWMSAAYRVDGLAWVASKQSKHEWAAKLFGAAATLWERCGAIPDVAVSIPHRMFLDATRDTLGAKRFDRAFAEGRSLTPEDLVRHGGDATVSSSPAHALAPLTRRESEVAELVAGGMTNREIADRLVIAQRTSDTHVQHILNKLGLTNRTQLAAWVTERRAAHAG